MREDDCPQTAASRLPGLQQTLDAAEAAARRGDWLAALTQARACSELRHAAAPGLATRHLLLQARAAMQLGLDEDALQVRAGGVEWLCCAAARNTAD